MDKMTTVMEDNPIDNEDDDGRSNRFARQSFAVKDTSQKRDFHRAILYFIVVLLKISIRCFFDKREQRGVKGGREEGMPFRLKTGLFLFRSLWGEMT